MRFICVYAILVTALLQGQVPPGVSGRLWVPDRTFNSVIVLDAASGEILKQIPVGRAPIEVEVVPGIGKAYVTDEGSDTVTVIDVRTMTVLRTLPTGSLPHHMMASADGKFVYFGLFGANRIGIIDTATDTVREVETGPAEARTHSVWATEDGGAVWVTNWITNEIASINPATSK